MSQPAAEPRIPPAFAEDGTKVIQSRFGTLTVSNQNPVVFPRGLLGMPDRSQYALVDYPNEKFKQFKLLQSLEDDTLCFIVLPVIGDSQILLEQDLRKACEELNIDYPNLSVLMIVSVHRGAESVRISVNARAPIFVDTPKRQATQYVLQNDRYLVQHFITS